MYAVLALIALLLTAGSFYMYTSRGGVVMYLVAFIVCLILFLIFGALFLAGRVNKTEDIHITE